MTVQQAITQLVAFLKGEGSGVTGQVPIASPARDARLLLAHAMDLPVQRLSLHAQDPVDEATVDLAFVYAGRRRQGEPVSHILGYREFYGRRFRVDGRVLDPRPETEVLVAEALKGAFADVLDLGTGSGAIILTLLAERTDAIGTATDISASALQVAEENAAALDVANRVHFEVSDWFQAIGSSYDLIVSNPPYIAEHEMDGLQPDVLFYEPRAALTDGADGLTAYRAITAGAPRYLRSGGRLMVEIGPTQGQAVSAMMANAGLVDPIVIPDLDGRDRVVAATNP